MIFWQYNAHKSSNVIIYVCEKKRFKIFCKPMFSRHLSVTPLPSKQVTKSRRTFLEAVLCFSLLSHTHSHYTNSTQQILGTCKKWKFSIPFWTYYTIRNSSDTCIDRPAWWFGSRLRFGYINRMWHYLSYYEYSVASKITLTFYGQMFFVFFK